MRGVRALLMKTPARGRSSGPTLALPYAQSVEDSRAGLTSAGSADVRQCYTAPVWGDRSVVTRCGRLPRGPLRARGPPSHAVDRRMGPEPNSTGGASRELVNKSGRRSRTPWIVCAAAGDADVRGRRRPPRPGRRGLDAVVTKWKAALRPAPRGHAFSASRLRPSCGRRLLRPPCSRHRTCAARFSRCAVSLNVIRMMALSRLPLAAHRRSFGSTEEPLRRATAESSLRPSSRRGTRRDEPSSDIDTLKKPFPDHQLLRSLPNISVTYSRLLRSAGRGGPAMRVSG